MKTKLAIIGSGDLGQQIAHIAKQTDIEVVGFYDDFAVKGDEKKGIKILGNTSNIENDFEKKIFSHLIIGVGYKHMPQRKELFEHFNKIIPFANIIHPSVYIDTSVNLGHGIVIYPGSVIDAQCKIENNVLMNVGCTIAHDTHIGAHSFLSPRVALAGFIKVGECCVLGINSTVIDNIKITRNTQLGGGAMVIKSIEQQGLYVGNPARFIR